MTYGEFQTSLDSVQANTILKFPLEVFFLKR